MKKLFIVSATLFFFVLLFLGIYNFAFKPQNAAKIVTSPSAFSKEDKNKEKGVIREISSKEAHFPKVIRQGEKLRYFSEGKVFESEQDGSGARPISGEDFGNVRNVQWSSTGDLAVFSQEIEGKEHFFVFRAQGGKKESLKGGIDIACWEGSAVRLLYKYFDSASGRKTLNVADADGSNWKEIAEVKERFLEIAAIPKTNLVSFWNRGFAAEKTSLKIVPVIGGSVKEINLERYGADYLWSPDGKKALVSSVDAPGSAKLELGVVGLDGSYKSLGVPTLVHKAVWSADGRTVYYALPGGIPEEGKLPDDYWQKKFPVRDSFWKADIESGKKERIVELDEITANFDVSQLLLTATENALLFTDRLSGKLYRIDL
ncbi:MAG TPA: hypothetical protein PKA31_01625 [Candidatus Moranbacteria bacterium]|nr:hypothetical protein [Candidatus Moranbacteria bacterium]